MPDGRKPPQVVDFHENRVRQDCSDTVGRLQQRITWLRPPSIQNPVLDRTNLML